jgi:hypothetical protein
MDGWMDGISESCFALNIYDMAFGNNQETKNTMRTRCEKALSG